MSQQRYQQSQERYQPPGQQQASPPGPVEPKSKILAIIAIIVIVVIIAIVIALSFATSHATLKVRIHSSHILSAVSYELYVDRNLKKSGVLSPGQHAEFTFDMYPGSSCKSYNIFASSTGGGFGGTSDSEDVHLCAGETKSVSLYI